MHNIMDSVYYYVFRWWTFIFLNVEKQKEIFGKVVQLFALTRWDKRGIIDHKFINHCDEKEEYLRRIFRELSVGVR